MNVGYFTHTNIGPSETFIYELVKGLNHKTNLDLTFICGSLAPINVDFKLRSYSTGFFEKNAALSDKLYKAGQIFGRKGYRWRYLSDKRTAEKCLNKIDTSSLDVAYIDYATSGVLLMDFLSKKDIPFVVHVHGYDVTAARNDPQYADNLSSLYKLSTYIITPSEHIKRVIVLNGCSPDKVKVIYPFQVPESLDESQWVDRFNHPPNITFLGRLTYKKNPIALLHAFSLVLETHPDVTLNILGDGELMVSCKKRVKELGIAQNVKFSGVVNQQKAFDTLCSTWVYVQHSVTSLTGDQEGFPVSLAEAAAHATPLVSTIHSGITENIIEGRNGFLVQEYDYLSMAERITELIDNPDKAKIMGEASRAHITKICGPGQRVDKIARLLKQTAYTNISQGIVDN